VQSAQDSSEPAPDLIVSRVEALTMTATSLDYLFVIKNIGDFQAILSDDDIYGNLGDRGAGSGPLTLEISELSPGGEYTYTSQSALQDVYYFDYDYFLVKVDAYGELVEADEDNNIGDVHLPDGADLDGPDEVNHTDNVGFRGVLSPDKIMDNSGDKAAGGSTLARCLPNLLQPAWAARTTLTSTTFSWRSMGLISSRKPTRTTT
jgi:hypothetical protein